MKSLFKFAAGSVLLAMAMPTLAAPPVDPLDKKFGVASQPAYVKHYEADRSGKVMLNPYLQVSAPGFPVVLDVKSAPFNWVIDANGRLAVIPEAAHPLGRVYEKGFFRPEDQSKRKPGTRENYGHPSATGGAPGRISGEILYDKDTKTCTINNKSGRFTKHNPDRTPEQLVEAAKLIRESVDTGGVAWGPVYFLLEYASEAVREPLMADPRLAYDDPKKKSRPHIIVLPGAASTVVAEKPYVAPIVAEPVVTAPAPAPAKVAEEPAKPAKGKKPKAAQNDDPS